ncbi:MAG: branched-chain amino acid ABC transporter permease [Chloroflexota bacterium]
MTTSTDFLATLRTWYAKNRRWTLIALFIIALIYPFFAPIYYRGLVIEVMIFGMFAMSLDLLLGYTGMPSFGHAAYFGLGVYGAAYLASSNPRALDLTSNLFIIIPIVVILVAIFALFVGFFAIRTTGIYFLMITLAAAQMVFSIFNRWTEVTGGSDGLTGVANATLGVGPLSYDFSPLRIPYYFLTLAFFLLAWYLMRRIINSPFGWTLQGIRENEGRMKSLGYNTDRYKLTAFSIAGAFAALAGVLQAHFFKGASPTSLFLDTSGEAMLALVIGGPGTLFGGVLGAFVVKMFPLWVSSYTERWQLLEGLVFIAFVMFAPNGILGYLKGSDTGKAVMEQLTKSVSNGKKGAE